MKRSEFLEAQGYPNVPRPATGCHPRVAGDVFFPISLRPTLNLWRSFYEAIVGISYHEHENIQGPRSAIISNTQCFFRRLQDFLYVALPLNLLTFIAPGRVLGNNPNVLPTTHKHYQGPQAWGAYRCHWPHWIGKDHDSEPTFPGSSGRRPKHVVGKLRNQEYAISSENAPTVRGQTVIRYVEVRSLSAHLLREFFVFGMHFAPPLTSFVVIVYHLRFINKNMFYPMLSCCTVVRQIQYRPWLTDFRHFPWGSCGSTEELMLTQF